MNTKNIAWSADIGCEGGPVIVANLADFSRWYGSEPPGQLLDMATGASGALLWLQPGMYQSALHYHSEASWGVVWCRLQRVGK